MYPIFHSVFALLKVSIIHIMYNIIPNSQCLLTCARNALLTLSSAPSQPPHTNGHQSAPSYADVETDSGRKGHCAVMSGTDIVLVSSTFIWLDLQAL